MFQPHPSRIPLLLIASCFTIMASSCDADSHASASETETYEADAVEQTQSARMDDLGAGLVSGGVQLPDESEVPWPQIDEKNPRNLLEQPQTQKAGFWTIEAFRFMAQPDFLSVTSPPGGLFAPFPAGIQPLEEATPGAFMLTFKMRDFASNIVGYGTLLEDLDFETFTGEDTYSLMIPGRGSIVFTQQEDFAWVFELIGDMIADQVTVRDYDPPIFNEGSLPGTVRFLGGTGEFQGIEGYAREIQFVERFNLETGIHDVGTILLVAYPS